MIDAVIEFGKFWKEIDNKLIDAKRHREIRRKQIEEIHKNTICFKCKSNKTSVTEWGVPKWNKMSDGNWYCDSCRVGYIWLGRHHTKESKNKSSLKQSGRKQPRYLVERRAKTHSGVNHWRWIGGPVVYRDVKIAIRHCEKYKIWHAQVLKKDNFKCVRCGNNKHLEVNHIIPFQAILSRNNILTFEQSQTCEQLWDVNNGEILCKQCHGIETISQIKSIRKIR